jgi:hypothetical protein
VLLLFQVERDGSEVVGLSPHMWLLLMLFVLVSGKIGWATWLFLILAGILLALINVLLLSRLREMTRGGHVRRQLKHKVGGPTKHAMDAFLSEHVWCQMV